MWVPKTQDFAKDSSEELGKSKVSGLRSVYGTSYFGLFSTLRAVWLCFMP